MPDVYSCGIVQQLLEQTTSSINPRYPDIFGIITPAYVVGAASLVTFKMMLADFLSNLLYDFVYLSLFFLPFVGPAMAVLFQ